MYDVKQVPFSLKGFYLAVTYINWSSFVEAHGLLKRDSMLISKKWMANIWSWDHCFNALAFVVGHPKEAWNQFILIFDFQDEDGIISDLVKDSLIVTDFVKRPFMVEIQQVKR